MFSDDLANAYDTLLKSYFDNKAKSMPHIYNLKIVQSLLVRMKYLDMISCSTIITELTKPEKENLKRMAIKQVAKALFKK